VLKNVFVQLCQFLSARKRGTCYGNVDGWVAVTLRYCIKKAKPIWKFFSTIWKPHHSSFLRPLRRYRILRGTPSAGALNTRGMGKLANFVWFSTDIAVYRFSEVEYLKNGAFRDKVTTKH